MKLNPPASSLEVLEPRIAPATLVNVHHVTYLDGDGDQITVTTSAGTFTTSNFHFDTAFNTAGGQLLQMLDLSGGGFSLANLTVTVKQAASGDGQVSLGYVNATTTDLGIVKIHGDLGRINAGDSDTTTAALQALKLSSLGVQGIDTQAAGGSTVSNLAGALGSLVIKGNVFNASIFVTGNAAADGRIGKIKINSLVGIDANRGEITATGDIGRVKLSGFLLGGADNSGRISAGGALGDVKIRSFLAGGTGTHAGELSANTSIGDINIGGGLIGGGGGFSANISSLGSIGNIHLGDDMDGSAGGARINSAGNMGAVFVKGGLIGGDVKGQSGQIYCQGIMKGATIHGSLIGGSQGDTGELIASQGVTGKIKITGDVIGGTAFQSGFISVGGTMLKSLIIKGSLEGGGSNGDNSHGFVSILNDLKFVRIGGDIVGGSINGFSGSMTGTGYLQAGGTIKKAIIGGSIIAGVDDAPGTLTRSGAIVAGSSIGSLFVKGDLVGNHAPTGGTTAVLIGASGQNELTPPVIGHLKVGGSVELANIIAGYQISQPMNNSNNSIGSVKVGKNWSESNLIAGALPGADGNYGTADDTGAASTIAKVVIGGTVAGTASGVNNSDHFGFVAGTVGTMTISGKHVKLTSQQDTIAVGTTGDVTVFETT